MSYEIQRIEPFKGKHFRIVRDGSSVALCATFQSAMRKREQLLAADLEAAMTCTRCGQASITRAVPNVCEPCRKVEREPQGETVRLFAPAPNQLPGQLSL